MTWMKRPLSLATLMLSLSLQWAIAPGLFSPALAQTVSSSSGSKINFKPPDRGSPETTAGGASRGACYKGDKELTPLMPPSTDPEKPPFGLTVSARPTFYWYVPRNPNQTADFLLLGDKDTQVVYQTTVKLPSKPGIIAFTLPNEVAPLQAGKSYHWYLTLTCDARGLISNPNVEGWIERTTPDAALSKKLAKAPAANHAALYAEAGIWHDALNALVKQQCNTTSNSKPLADWKELLNSVGLSSIVAEPLVGICPAK